MPEFFIPPTLLKAMACATWPKGRVSGSRFEHVKSRFDRKLDFELLQTPAQLDRKHRAIGEICELGLQARQHGTQDRQQ